ncbi:MAG: monovalent cation/H(+) antiporter subunit G [Yoonia sp.]|nr:monovalent cation/H(+) antiporter subunit G [Yoonia sp.]MDG1861853.1 monovalent cation/H(+) antiporter subunit G [Yoonia sp.]
MTGQIIGTYLVAICLIIGSAFVVIGVVGLLKFNDPMTRLHAPTKVGTIGIGMLLLASMVQSVVAGESSFHELLILAFLFVTAPISANFIAKVHIHRKSCPPAPKPPRDDTWSTLKTPSDES